MNKFLQKRQLHSKHAQLTEDDKRWLALSPKHKKFLLKVLDAKLENEE